MIKDTIDFDYAISQIAKNTEPTVYLQGNVLNSDYINKSFKEIEKNLNTLYEKTRYLEDAIAYTKEFLETRIHHFSNEISSVLHEIENVADSAKNLSYISYNVPFIKGTKQLTDRDGVKTITPLVIRNNNLTLDYLINQNQEFTSWTRVCDSVPYESNIKKVTEENYRSIYLEEKTIPGGLTETIFVHFKQPTVVNVLDIEPVNCAIKNLKFGLINGIEETVGDYSIDMSTDIRICNYIKFDLVCSSYNLNVYTLNKALMTDNIWSIIRDFEYSSIANLESKFDASAIISKSVTNSITGQKKTIAYASQDGISTTTMKLYSYVFGINKFEIKNSQYYTDGYMISDPITIGHLEENEYIRLDVKHNKNGGEIAYSILDGDIEVPIAIMTDEWIENELVFGSEDTRFPMDYDTVIENPIIKKNGSIIETTYVDAKKLAENSNDRYSITYKASQDYFDYKPLNKTIRIKCYIRSYGNVKHIPYISSITIKKYGEESLWINRF